MDRNPKNLGENRRTSGGAPSKRSAEPTAPLPPLAVVELTPSRRAGNLRAFVAVRFGKWLVVRGWRVVEQPGQAPWASVPMQERPQPDGSARFFPIIDLPENWKRAAQALVLEAWREYEETGTLPGVRVIGGERAA
jgi:DNA-binding cell septation regulator SpoVG